MFACTAQRPVILGHELNRLLSHIIVYYSALRGKRPWRRTSPSSVIIKDLSLRSLRRGARRHGRHPFQRRCRHSVSTWAWKKWGFIPCWCKWGGKGAPPWPLSQTTMAVRHNTKISRIWKLVLHHLERDADYVGTQSQPRGEEGVGRKRILSPVNVNEVERGRAAMTAFPNHWDCLSDAKRLTRR